MAAASTAHASGGVGVAGWANQPTRIIYRWLTTDQAAYEEACQSAKRGPGALRVHVIEKYLPHAGLDGELALWASSQADWTEIAEAMA